MAPAIELAGVSKQYGALRPLRLQQLAVAAGESVAVVGLERGAAEVLVNLITGAALPDAGEIRIFGRPTAAIADGADWLASLERFGIVSDRAVLLDQLTVVQNLSIPFTLDVEPPPDDVRLRASALAREVGIAESMLDAPVGAAGPAVQTRVRLGRALALDPRILLLEHATATLDASDARDLGRGVRAIATARGIAVLAMTADRAFADAASSVVLTHDPATGALTAARRSWFRRG